MPAPRRPPPPSATLLANPATMILLAVLLVVSAMLADAFGDRGALVAAAAVTAQALPA